MAMRDVRFDINEQMASVNLIALVRPERLSQVKEEVARRTTFFEDTWRTSVGPQPPHTTPKCAALISVKEDLARGLF